MGVLKENFGQTKAGEDAYLYTLENSKGMKVKISNYGGAVVSVLVKDKNGNIDDVVLGWDDVSGYEDNGCFLGVIVGRNANRIANSEFEIDGVKYQLEKNENGNNLHSSFEYGYHKRIWDSQVQEEKNAVVLRLHSPDGDQGFPGNCNIKVTYTLTEDNELKIAYEAESDKNTIINLTNHSYFNLAGHKSGTILDHQLKLHASAYTEIQEGAIPTGRLVSVEGTPMDFRQGKEIGEEINAEYEQLKLTNGYDHNWVIDKTVAGVEKIAEVIQKETGRKMEVFTDLPGVQFYAGNSIGSKVGKEKMEYKDHSGMCLETQYFPNSANERAFVTPEFGKDKKYKTTTIYRFSIEE